MHFFQDQDALCKLFIHEPKKIVRSSGQYDFEDGLSFQVLMSNPVQQGCVFSGNRTRVLVVDLSESANDVSSELPSATSISNIFNMLDSPTAPHVIEPKEFDVKILNKKWPEARLYPAPNSNDDDECRVFVDIKDLAKCGVFSGDWVLVSANDPKKSRLCRVFGIDDVSNTE